MNFGTATDAYKAIVICMNRYVEKENLDRLLSSIHEERLVWADFEFGQNLVTVTVHIFGENKGEFNRKMLFDFYMIAMEKGFGVSLKSVTHHHGNETKVIKVRPHLIKIKEKIFSLLKGEM